MKTNCPTQFDVIVIGVSTGGPEALEKVISKLPGNLNVPILVVQHIPEAFTHSLVKQLQSKCALNIKIAAHQEAILPGTVYIAPGGKHMQAATSAPLSQPKLNNTN